MSREKKRKEVGRPSLFLQTFRILLEQADSTIPNPVLEQSGETEREKEKGRATEREIHIL